MRIATRGALTPLLAPMLVQLLLLAPAAAMAQAPAPEAGTQAPAQAPDDGEILVVGDNGRSYRLSADQLRDMARAWRQHRPAFAPAADLTFKVEPRGDAALDGLALILSNEDDGEALEIALDADRLIRLPVERMVEGKWRLRANRPRAGINLRPRVFSPGTDDRNRRLGDMRLQCRVWWAFANNDLPIWVRAGGNLIGLCNSSRVALFATPEVSFSTARMMPGDLPVEIGGDRKSVRWPLHDRTMSNDARMVLE